MGSRPLACAAPTMEGSSTVAIAGPIATVPRARGASPTGRRADSSAWSPSVKRTRTASRALSAAVPPGVARAPSSGAVCPWGSAVRESPVTARSSPRQERARRVWSVTGASAASHAGWRMRRAAHRAMPVRREMMERRAFQTAACWGVPAGNGASASMAVTSSASSRCTGNAPRSPVRRGSGATCACCVAAESSGARACATLSALTAAQRIRSAA
jgi:hypothetical protein